MTDNNGLKACCREHKYRGPRSEKLNVVLV